MIECYHSVPSWLVKQHLGKLLVLEGVLNARLLKVLAKRAIFVDRLRHQLLLHLADAFQTCRCKEIKQRNSMSFLTYQVPQSNQVESGCSSPLMTFH